MILHDLPWFDMILHDPFGAQEPRNVSTDCKTSWRLPYNVFKQAAGDRDRIADSNDAMP